MNKQNSQHNSQTNKSSQHNSQSNSQNALRNNLQNNSFNYKSNYNYKITILGCGSSSGIPSINGFWGDCNSENTKNIRQRSSILIQYNQEIQHNHLHDSKDNQQYNQQNTILRNILIDTSPDLRSQLLLAKIKKVDAALYTHPHSDHILGIHDLSFLCSNTFKYVSKDLIEDYQKFIPIYGSRETLSQIIQMFPYLFCYTNHVNPQKMGELQENNEDSSTKDEKTANSKKNGQSQQNEDIYILPVNTYDFPNYMQNTHSLNLNRALFAQELFYNESFNLFGEKVTPFAQDHSSCTTTGFKFSSMHLSEGGSGYDCIGAACTSCVGTTHSSYSNDSNKSIESNFAYSTDVFDLDKKAFDHLKNLDLWIVSCAKYKKTQANHAGFEKVMQWIEKAQPKKAILTHMGMDMDYETVSAKLPPNVELAYDGMEVYV